MRGILGAVVAASLVGCSTVSFYDVEDPVIGNWGLTLTDCRKANAGSLIVSRTGDGAPEALFLWRCASPAFTTNVTLNGKDFKVVHPDGVTLSGSVDGLELSATATDADGKTVSQVRGWRNPPVPSRFSTSDIIRGEPIDLLADGVGGWTAADPDAKNGWAIHDDDGVRILSNSLGRADDGSVPVGTDLRTLREDFYDFNLEYDVRVRPGTDSGVFLRGRYEIQVADSHGKSVSPFGMGAYCGRVAPSDAVEKPAGEWQHVSVTLFKRHLSVVLNGVTVLDSVPVVGVTGGAMDANEFARGPIRLQGDRSDVDFKNIILRPALN